MASDKGLPTYTNTAMAELYKVKFAIEIVSGLLGVFANCLILVTFLLGIRQKTPAIILIIALGFGDLFYSIGTAPMRASSHMLFGIRSRQYNESHVLQILCRSVTSLDLAIEHFTVLLHGLIAINRYYVVCRSTSYSRIGVRATIVLIASSASLSVLTGVLAGFGATTQHDDHGDTQCYFNKNWHIVMLAVFYSTLIVTLALIVILNTKMVVHVRNVQRMAKEEIQLRNLNNGNRIADRNDNVPEVDSNAHSTLNQSTLPSVEDTSIGEPSSFQGGSDQSIPRAIQVQPVSFKQRESSNQDKDKPENIPHPEPQLLRDYQRKTLNKMSKTLLMTTTLFVLLWIPAVAVYSIPTSVMAHLSQTHESLMSFIIFCGQMRRFNHFINPIIYGVMCNNFRVAFRRMFCNRPT